MENKQKERKEDERRRREIEKGTFLIVHSTVEL